MLLFLHLNHHSYDLQSSIHSWQLEILKRASHSQSYVVQLLHLQLCHHQYIHIQKPSELPLIHTQFFPLDYVSKQGTHYWQYALLCKLWLVLPSEEGGACLGRLEVELELALGRLGGQRLLQLGSDGADDLGLLLAEDKGGRAEGPGDCRQLHLEGARLQVGAQITSFLEL